MNFKPLFVVCLPFIGACSSVYRAPPAAPAQIVPVSPDVPTAPPVDGTGRVTIDVAGEPARVSRVVDTLEPSDPHLGAQAPTTSNSRRGVAYGSLRRTELLCLTPCVVDLRLGAHTLSFASTTDNTRASSSDVVVGSRPSIVRHVLGTEKPTSNAYMGGALLTAIGGSLSLFGGILTGASLARSPSQPGSGALPIGLVLAGIGLALGIPGVALMFSERPVHQPGATTQWLAQ